MSDMERFEDDQSAYLFQELIGKGAFGNVYKATESITHEEVAIKVNILSCAYLQFLFLVYSDISIFIISLIEFI